MADKKLTFTPGKKKQEINRIFNFDANAFANAQDFEWTEENIKNEIQDGWKLFSVDYDGEVVAALFTKVADNTLFTKNTPIKLNYQGNGFSHQIKDHYEQLAREKGLARIVNYCKSDNFRMISLNEGHNYHKTGRELDDNIIEWEKHIK